MIKDKLRFAKEWGTQKSLGQSTNQAFEIGKIAEDIALYDFQKSLVRNNEVDVKAPDFVIKDFPDIFVDAKTCRAYGFRNCARSFGRIEVAIECIQNMHPDYYSETDCSAQILLYLDPSDPTGRRWYKIKREWIADQIKAVQKFARDNKDFLYETYYKDYSAKPRQVKLRREHLERLDDLDLQPRDLGLPEVEMWTMGEKEQSGRKMRTALGFWFEVPVEAIIYKKWEDD